MSPLTVIIDCLAAWAIVLAVLAVLDYIRSWPKPDQRKPGLKGLR
jgi:hypothetical protein